MPKHSLNYGKKQDVFMFGLLMLSLIKGKEVSNESFEIPVNISNTLYDFLTRYFMHLQFLIAFSLFFYAFYRCLAKDDKDRFTAAQLINHPFLKNPLERYSPKRSIESNIPSRNASPENPGLDLKSLLSTNGTSQSRVQTEFEVLDCLGKGAYGEVFKVNRSLFCFKKWAQQITVIFKNMSLI